MHVRDASRRCAAMRGQVHADAHDTADSIGAALRLAGRSDLTRVSSAAAGIACSGQCGLLCLIGNGHLAVPVNDEVWSDAGELGNGRLECVVIVGHDDGRPWSNGRAVAAQQFGSRRARLTFVNRQIQVGEEHGYWLSHSHESLPSVLDWQ